MSIRIMETVTHNLQGNIWKYAVLLIANKRIFVAILGAYYLTIPDVTAQSIGIILLLGNLSGFVLEIPSGYVSDKMGHKHALVLSRILMLLSTVFFLVANDFTFLILGSVFLSASQAFHSGTGSAFMHETLRGLGREHEYTKVMGRISSIGFAVPIILMVLVPFLVGISYKLPFLIALVIDVIGVLAAAVLTTPPVLPEHVEEIGATNFRQVMREGYRYGFFALAIFSGIVSGTLFAISGFRAPYQEFVGIPVIWFGVLFGIGRALASLMLAYSGWIKERFSLVSFYGFRLFAYAFMIVLLGIVDDWKVVALVFIVSNAFTWGLSKVNEGYQIEVIRSSKFKATLLSVTAQIDNIVGAVIGFGLGFAIEHASYRAGFLCTAIVFLTLLLPLYIYIVRRSRTGAYGITNAVVAAE